MYSRPLRISRYACRYGYEDVVAEDEVLCLLVSGVVESVDERPPCRMLAASKTEWTLSTARFLDRIE